MSGDRALALALALSAVLSVVAKRGLGLDEVSEAAVDELLQYRAYNAEQVPLAIFEIEGAVDALSGHVV
ncbi:hypothetical protein ABQX22_13520 [Xanthomonas sp. WHRI 1810A]|uniref:hypothetical protein n=1 Tax=Xanthomonas sp. WHRI 1810A TaxID=3161565 RepID=UPI0032E8C865